MNREGLLINSGLCVCMNDPKNEHYHDEFEIFYIARGCARVTVGRQEYEATRGTVIFIGKLEEHSIRMLSEDYAYYFLVINSSRLEQNLRTPRLISIFRNRMSHFRHAIDLSADAELMDAYFEDICREDETKEEYYNEKNQTYLTAILIHAYRRDPQKFSFVDTHTNAMIYEIEQYFEERYMHDIRISDVAESHYISMNYLTQCFKSLTGRTPKQYLGECRIANAKQMLIHSDISVQNIAIKCGFNDVNNFIRKFKAETGVTPYKYKEKEKGP